MSGSTPKNFRRELERYVHRFQRRLKKKLQKAIGANREVLTSALLPSVKNPPSRWKNFLGEYPKNQDIERMLRSELANAFGQSDDVFQDKRVCRYRLCPTGTLAHPLAR